MHPDMSRSIRIHVTKYPFWQQQANENLEIKSQKQLRLYVILITNCTSII